MALKKKLIIVFFVLIIALVLFTVGVAAYILFVPTNVNLNKLNNKEQLITVYDSNMSKINNSNSYVKYDEIPKKLINAFIAVEDKRFYKHHGVDYIRLVGALKSNITSNSTQGASTITQQLAKNIYLTPEKSISRKISEIRIAKEIERNLTKNEILEKYLNMLYFGSGEYGIKNAAYRFFEKDLNDLTLRECALLAGIVKSPTKYNPIHNLDNSIARSNIVLELLYNQNYIDKNELIEAKFEVPIIKNALIHNNIYSRYSENVYFEASKVLNVNLDDLAYLDIDIHSYMDNNVQQKLYDTVTNTSYYTKNHNGLYPDYIGLIVDNNTSGISGFYSNMNINLNTFSRSPGSTIKPFSVYGPALEKDNYHLFTKVSNQKQSFNEYSPSNYKDIYSDYETINDSLKYSYNIPAISILNDIGVDYSKSYLNKYNIKLTENDNLSIGLGGLTYGIDMVTLASMYKSLSNEGMYSKASFIKEIKAKDGTTLYKHNLQENKVYNSSTTELLTTALIDCSKTGTAKKLAALPFEIASKTGTVSYSDKNYNTDVYNVSYTSELTHLFWIGATNNEKLLSTSITGGGTTSKIAYDFTNSYYKGQPTTAISNYENIDKIYIDKDFYELNDYVISDMSSPTKTRMEVLVKKDNKLNKFDNSYSNMSNINYDVIYDGDQQYININLNKKLCYKIYKRGLFNEQLLYTVKNKSGEYTFPIDKNFIGKYIIVPYYLDDNNKEIIGLPTKYNNFSILDII